MSSLHQSSLDSLKQLMARPLERPAPRSGRAGWIAFTGALAFLAGVVGGIVGLALTYPSPALAPATVVGRPSGGFRNTDAFPALAPIAAATVDIVAVPRDGVLPAAVPLAKRLGRGVAVTSDGWIVTLRSALPPAGQRPAIATANRRLHAVARAAFDPISDLVFLHVPTLEESVLPLRDRDALRVGDDLLAPTPEGGVLPMTLRARRARRAAVPVVTSDRWEHLLAFAAPAVILPGSPAVDRDGAMVGLVLDGDHAVPVEAIASALPSLFRDGAVVRNVLGVTVRDTSAFAFSAAQRGDGLTLAREGTTPLFSAASPLRDVLRDGDTLLAIADDPLTAQRPIAELLQEYPLGATVPLRVRRKTGGEETVTATLSKVTGETVGYGADKNIQFPIPNFQ